MDSCLAAVTLIKAGKLRELMKVFPCTCPICHVLCKQLGSIKYHMSEILGKLCIKNNSWCSIYHAVCAVCSIYVIIWICAHLAPKVFLQTASIGQSKTCLHVLFVHILDEMTYHKARQTQFTVYHPHPCTFEGPPLIFHNLLTDY